MEPFRFTDAAGREWEVVDFRWDLFGGKKKRLPLGDWEAFGRAFVPIGREAPIMLYEFGRVAYRDTRQSNLQSQLDHALPSTATPAERLHRDG